MKNAMKMLIIILVILGFILLSNAFVLITLGLTSDDFRLLDAVGGVFEGHNAAEQRRNPGSVCGC